MVTGIKEKVSAHEYDKATAQRTARQSVEQNWDCSQIEHEEEEQEDDWRKENHLEVQCNEDEKMEETFRTKKDGRKLFAGGRPAKGIRVSGT